jgi:hypothetical protein
MRKIKLYKNYGPVIITMYVERAEHINANIVTAYVEHVSLRSHVMQNDAVRDQFLRGLMAVIGVAADDYDKVYDEFDKDIVKGLDELDAYFKA